MPVQLLRSDNLSLALHPAADGREGHDLVVEGKPSAHFGFALFRMVRSGPQMTLGTTLQLDGAGGARMPLFDAFPDGLYVAVTAPPPTDNRLTYPVFAAPPAGRPFWIGANPPADLNAAVTSAIAEHLAFDTREIRQAGYTGDDRQILHVLVDACLLDYPQTFEGGRLAPLPVRLGVGSIVEAVNALLPTGYAFTDATELSEGYGRDHPLALITFVNVAAESDEEAINAIQPRLRRVLGALTLDRGASPSPIAYISERPGPAFSLRVSQTIYRGNLVAGFGPGITGLLDAVEHAAQADPWIEFAFGQFRNLRLQTDPSAQVYQAWAMIEAAAKRKVARDPAVAVRNGAGLEISNQGRDLGRVLVYLRDTVGLDRMGSAIAPGDDFYARVENLYRARNRIAHEGGIDSPANPTPAPNVHALAFMARDWVEAVLRHEIAEANRA